jgi:hypothetical protein
MWELLRFASPMRVRPVRWFRGAGGAEPPHPYSRRGGGNLVVGRRAPDPTPADPGLRGDPRLLTMGA